MAERGFEPRAPRSKLDTLSIKLMSNCPLIGINCRKGVMVMQTCGNRHSMHLGHLHCAIQGDYIVLMWKFQERQIVKLELRTMNAVKYLVHVFKGSEQECGGHYNNLPSHFIHSSLLID